MRFAEYKQHTGVDGKVMYNGMTTIIPDTAESMQIVSIADIPDGARDGKHFVFAYGHWWTWEIPTNKVQ